MDPRNKLFDKRTLDRNLKKGIVSQSDVDEYITALPDMESEAEEIDLEGKKEEEQAAIAAQEQTEVAPEESFTPPSYPETTGYSSENPFASTYSSPSVTTEEQPSEDTNNITPPKNTYDF